MPNISWNPLHPDCFSLFRYYPTQYTYEQLYLLHESSHEKLRSRSIFLSNTEHNISGRFRPDLLQEHN